MEEALDEDEVASSLADIKASPDAFVESRRPIFRKTALAMKEEHEAAIQAAEIQQEIRDHSMSPADMLVEVRSLIRKQNAGFDAMRDENRALQARVAELEAVVKAMMTLPQLCQSRADVCGFAQSERLHTSWQGGSTTLLRHATEQQFVPVVDYLLRIGRTPGEERSIIVLNPPEECRTYEQPKPTTESSALYQGSYWTAAKDPGSGREYGWLQIDAGRVVHVMGWHFEKSPGAQPHFNLSGSTDAKEWYDIQTIHIQHESQWHVASTCIASARYFRLKPHYTGTNTGTTAIRVGFLILDDNGQHLTGPRRVRDLSPLHIAAKAGATELITKLLDNGADPELLADCWNTPTAGVTPLQLAASAASLPAVQLLVNRGAEVHKHRFNVPQGRDGDLVAGFLQTNGSNPVVRPTVVAK